MTWVAMLVVLALASGCGGERRVSSAPTPAVTAREEQAEPSPDTLGPQLGTPTVAGGGVTLWTDPARGLVLSARRDPASPGVDPGERGWSEVTVIARDRHSPAHLVRTWIDDLYWVEHRPAEGRCDFVRRLHDAREPEILFEDDLGDPRETVCPTAITVDTTGGDHLYWVHGSEIRTAVAEPGATARVLARDQPWTTELAGNGLHLYFVALGADPRSGTDPTGRGSLRAIPIEGGEVRVLGEGLTAPYGLEITGTAIEVTERGSDAVRRFLWASPPIPPG